jgi:hypothetical protein
VAWLFCFAMFLAALLLFSVQPMVGKMVLPVLGGTPGVWNTCMVFFQAALLVGYAYAHVGSISLSFRRQYAVHALLLIVVFLALPISITADLHPPGSGGLAPPLWLFSVLVAQAGLPFFAIAATAPLLQRWFSLSEHPRAQSPYFLYSASNTGSLAAVFSYPWIVEPFLALSRQTKVWQLGADILFLLVLISGALVEWQRSSKSHPPRVDDSRGLLAVGPSGPAPSSIGDSVPSLRKVASWAALAFIPSTWLLAVTTYITTDLAAIPLLWTVPLGLYLLTYILAFTRVSPLLTRAATALLPMVVVPLVMVLGAGLVHLHWIPLHLLAFFVGAMVCHGQLAALRPEAQHATTFFLVIASGGVLGGAFIALLAPLVFDRPIEYPLAVVLASLATPGAARPVRLASRRDWLLDLILPLFVSASTALLVKSPGGLVGTVPGMIAVMLTAGLGLYACVTSPQHPVRFALTVAGVLLASGLARYPGGQVIHRSRDFYGSLRVLHDSETRTHRLFLGSTLHGQQCLDPARRCEPSSYYTPSGPIGQVFEVMGPTLKKNRGHVGVIGLGAGTLASYAQPGQLWTFYEIDEAVTRIALDTTMFTYCNDCSKRGVELRIIQGDARLHIREAPDRGYLLIVLDAFSSDVVPIHLLAREAISLYESKLADGGLLAFHLSSRYLDLGPLLALQAADAGLVCRVRRDLFVDEAESRSGKQPSIWAVMARRQSDLGELAANPRWQAPRARPQAKAWTDDYSEVASYLLLGGQRLPAVSTAPWPGRGD